MFQRNQPPGAGPANANQPVVTAPSRLRPAAPPASIDEAIAPVAAAAAGDEQPDGSVTVQLSRPLNTHAGEARSIRLRPIKYVDVVEIGEVDRVFGSEIDANGKPARMEHALDREAMMRWMVRLTGLDRIVLGEMSLADGRKVETAIRRMLMLVAQGN
jgi:hypothetical protein